MLEYAQHLLQKYFGCASFREGQEQVIERVLSGSNTMCIMQTGGGYT